MDDSQELFDGISFDLGFDDDLKDEGVANIDKSMQHFDPNNLHNEDVYSLNVCFEDANNSSARNEIVQPYWPQQSCFGSEYIFKWGADLYLREWRVRERDSWHVEDFYYTLCIRRVSRINENINIRVRVYD